MTGETEVLTGEVTCRCGEPDPSENARRGAVPPHGMVWNVSVGWASSVNHLILCSQLTVAVKNMAAISLGLPRVPNTL